MRQCACPYNLKFVSDCFKTEDMCDKVVHRDPYALRYVPDNLKTQEMYNRLLQKTFLTILYTEIKNVLIKEDAKIWSKRGYN